MLVPKGHGQSTTDLLMKAHALNLHTSLPGTFLAKGMLNETNQNFIEERILHQNKVNNQSASLDIYKLTDSLLHHEYTKKLPNGTTTTTYQ